MELETDNSIMLVGNIYVYIEMLWDSTSFLYIGLKLWVPWGPADPSLFQWPSRSIACSSSFPPSQSFNKLPSLWAGSHGESVNGALNMQFTRDVTMCHYNPAALRDLSMINLTVHTSSSYRISLCSHPHRFMRFPAKGYDFVVAIVATLYMDVNTLQMVDKDLEFRLKYYWCFSSPPCAFFSLFLVHQEVPLL